MEHAQLDSKGWSHLLARLGGEKAIASSAREHGAFVRARGVKSAVDVLRLALMYGPGGQSLRSLAALAAAAGLADISDVAILDRLKMPAIGCKPCARRRWRASPKRSVPRQVHDPYGLSMAVDLKAPASGSGGFTCVMLLQVGSRGGVPPRSRSGPHPAVKGT